MIAREGEQERGRQPSLKILILEDDALAAAAFAAALKDEGHEIVAIADSAGDGIARARRQCADLALVDIGLSDGRTGLAAARALRDHFTIPTILVSGEVGLAAKADAVHAIGYIAKPADANAVARTVQRIVGYGMGPRRLAATLDA